MTLSKLLQAQFLGLHRWLGKQSQPAPGFIPSLGTKRLYEPSTRRLGRLQRLLLPFPLLPSA